MRTLNRVDNKEKGVVAVRLINGMGVVALRSLWPEKPHAAKTARTGNPIAATSNVRPLAAVGKFGKHKSPSPGHYHVFR